MSGELEVTEELRQQYARETAEALQREGLNPDRVEVWEDGYRTAKQSDAFEWWYFDAQFDDGSTAVLTFTTKPMTKPKSPLVPLVLFMHRSPGGKSVRQTVTVPADRFSASTDGCDVRMGDSWVKGDLNQYELHAEVEGSVAHLRITGGAPPWRPGAAVSYFNSAKTKYFAWVVPVPYGTVEGELTVEGETRSVKGTVYHDHNWGNAYAGGVLDHWYWGRAHVGDFSVIYVQMVTMTVFGHGGLKLPVFYLAKGDRILTDDGMPMRLTITDPKLIESIDLVEDVPRWERPLIHLMSNPYYYDFDAELELTVDLAGVKAQERGRTVFEKMMFR